MKFIRIFLRYPVFTMCVSLNILIIYQLKLGLLFLEEIQLIDQYEKNSFGGVFEPILFNRKVVAQTRRLSEISRSITDSFEYFHEIKEKNFPDWISNPADYNCAQMKTNGNASKIVFDIGFNNGTDAKFYLSRGFRVVAVDADLSLVKIGLINFRSYVQSGKLVLVHAGIEEDLSADVVFYKSVGTNGQSSFDPNKARCPQCVKENVPLKRCEGLFDFGIPHYLRIDIEERHYTCVRALVNVRSCYRPQFVSYGMHENAFKFSYPILDTELMILLWKLGYREMKLIEIGEGNPDAVIPEDGRNYVTKKSNWTGVTNFLQQGVIKVPKANRKWHFLFRKTDESVLPNLLQNSIF